MGTAWRGSTVILIPRAGRRLVQAIGSTGCPRTRWKAEALRQTATAIVIWTIASDAPMQICGPIENGR